jgi:hypothetical protein
MVTELNDNGHTEQGIILKHWFEVLVCGQEGLLSGQIIGFLWCRFLQNQAISRSGHEEISPGREHTDCRTYPVDEPHPAMEVES